MSSSHSIPTGPTVQAPLLHCVLGPNPDSAAGGRRSMTAMDPVAALPRQLLSLVPLIAISAFVTTRLELSLRYMAGVRCYFLAEHVPAGVKGRALKSQKRSDEMEDASLIVSSLTKRDLAKMTFFSLYDALFFIIVLALASFAMSQLSHSFGRPLDRMPVTLAASCVMVGLYMLVKVDLLAPKFTSAEDRIYAACIFVLAFLLALVALTKLPHGMLGFDIEAAAAMVGPLLTETLRARSPNAQDLPEVSLPAVALQLMLAVWGGALSMSLFQPALRFVRSYWLETNVPDWALSYVGSGLVTKLLLTLHLLLPMLAPLLWLKPVNDELLGLDPRPLLLAQTGVLLGAGVVQLATLRTVVQRFADTALTAWHTLKHGGLGSKKVAKTSGTELIRIKCSLVYMLVGKTAVQGLGVAAIFLGLGLLHLFSALLPSPEAAGSADGLVRSLAGFVAWWTGLSWLAFCCLDLWLFRTGTLTN